MPIIKQTVTSYHCKCDKCGNGFFTIDADLDSSDYYTKEDLKKALLEHDWEITLTPKEKYICDMCLLEKDFNINPELWTGYTGQKLELYYRYCVRTICDNKVEFQSLVYIGTGFLVHKKYTVTHFKKA